jgi:hypothetical protein
MDDRQNIDRRDSVAWAAGVSLAMLIRDVGAPGRVAMRSRPSLLARVDQYAAEIRDHLGDHDGRIALTALAAYSDWLIDIASRHGADPLAAARAGRWDGLPWPLVRLIAVCRLAETAANHI